MTTCPLCGDEGSLLCVDRGTQKEFYRCGTCDLHFLRPSDRLALDQERAHYAHHQNSPDDTRYQAFVAPLVAAITERIPPPSRGLDFGAGPGPVLAQMLRKGGYAVSLYDPIYWTDTAALTQTYAFIGACEVVEHFFRPLEEFIKLAGLLETGGTLALMTLLVPGDGAFESWYYRKDPTHVVFYSEKTFAWLQRRLGFASMVSDGRRLIVLTK